MTTLRDQLAEKVVAPLAATAALKRIPCSAFLAPLAYPPPNDLRDEEKYIMINYMSGAGHYDYGLNIDHEKWESTIVELVQKLKRDHRVAFMCHNDAEKKLAQSLELDVPVFLPASIQDYFVIASSAKCGVFNRMHACVGFAGLGIPSVGVGVDSRMMMVQEIGLKTVYVKDADAQDLADNVEHMLSVRDAEKSRLEKLQSETLMEYVEILKTSLR
jgi:hypothetical protein